MQNHWPSIKIDAWPDLSNSGENGEVTLSTI